MATVLKSTLALSGEDYLEREKISEVRHELIAGEVFAMAGGSLNHNRISGNIFGALDDALNGSACRPYMSDVKVMVRTLQDENFYYPDVVVTCDPNDRNDYFLESPTVIFEVLSPSTEKYDRAEKFFAYRSLASLEEYVVVSQDLREVTVARRKNGWEAEVMTGDDFELQLACGGVKLTADRIYRGVEWD